MPFIDDELFWYSDNDGKMDLTQCLQVSNQQNLAQLDLELGFEVNSLTLNILKLRYFLNMRLTINNRTYDI